MVIIRPTSTCLIRLNHVHVSRFHLTQHHSFFESRNLFTFKSCLHQCSVQFLSWVKFHHLSVLYLFIFLCLEWYTFCYLIDILSLNAIYHLHSFFYLDEVFHLDNIVNHKNYNFLACDWFKKVLFSTGSLAKLLSDSLLLDRPNALSAQAPDLARKRGFLWQNITLTSWMSQIIAN